MSDTENYLDSFDGTKIFYTKDIPSNPKATILIVHGIAEHCGRYEYVKNKFVENGYVVYKFDHRGHGKSDGKRGYVNSFKDFVEDIDSFVELIKKEYSNIPLFIFGHSMGGFITACYGILYGDKICGQILSGAATGDIPFSVKLKSLKFPYFFRGQVPNQFCDLVCTNKDVVEQYKSDELVLKNTTVRLNLQIANSGIKWLKNNIKNYNCPCLILHGKEDKIVSPKSSVNFYDTISSKDKDIKLYDNLYHEILNEDCKDNILDDIIKWLNIRIS
ncbi:lysophospholipase [Clostridium aestuarii]|uniref:Lysophospholipase n=1 Tax=Clostridium aestuarii TaxID=338193 RepID=A0ABT4CZ09_9CLOT|nr:alpha/beta hydrolase [Clostridium aestuarii]MCY6484211.1 lysophospholipase [Clostridium aestuarii]